MPNKYESRKADIGDLFKSMSKALKIIPSEVPDKTAGPVQMTEPPKHFSQVEDCFFTHPYGGVRAVIAFPNGYSASIIQTSFSYGGEQGLYEIAVMRDDCICYDTPLTDDVIGRLSKKAVLEVCKEIFNLPNHA